MTGLAQIFAEVPDWARGVGVFLLAGILALALYLGTSHAILALANRQAAPLRSLFLRARRLICLALVFLALSASAQLPYFPERLGDLLSKLTSVAVAVLVGWSALIAVDVASAFYLRRYKLDVADNIVARKHFTQVRMLKRVCTILIMVITVAAALMAFEPVRQFGVSLFASAGAAGIVVGLAARPVLSNLIAGIQLAVTQPIRINDVVVVEGEWGEIEEITSTYVVIKVWDLRRQIIPLSYFMEKPFQNWTRETAQIIGAVTFQVDYSIPVARVREKAIEIVHASKLWDRKVFNLQVTECRDMAVELRILATAASGPAAWDLRCEVREKLLDYLQSQMPEYLPRRRQQAVAVAAARENAPDTAPE
jgi:small-conductance mechanosensitive channel